MTERVRMTGKERREQLIVVGRTLFAEKGFEAVSVEEIALSAKVSKPVVYEHFGSKDGLYAVVVDREMTRLLTMITSALTAGHPRELLEQAGLALFDYIETSTDGFRILVRDSPVSASTGNFASLILASQVQSQTGSDVFTDAGWHGGAHRPVVVGLSPSEEGRGRGPRGQPRLEWVVEPRGQACSW